jgi:hypothetical protein
MASKSTIKSCCFESQKFGPAGHPGFSREEVYHMEISDNCQRQIIVTAQKLPDKGREDFHDVRRHMEKIFWRRAGSLPRTAPVCIEDMWEPCCKSRNSLEKNKASSE